MGKGKRGPDIPDQEKIAKAGTAELVIMQAGLEQQRVGETVGSQKFQKLDDALRAVRRAIEAKAAGGNVHQAVTPQRTAPKPPESAPTRSPSPQAAWQAVRAKTARLMGPKAPAPRPPVAPPAAKPPVIIPYSPPAKPPAKAPYSPPVQTDQGTNRGATGDFGLFAELRGIAEEEGEG